MVAGALGVLVVLVSASLNHSSMCVKTIYILFVKFDWTWFKRIYLSMIYGTIDCILPGMNMIIPVFVCH